MKILGHAHCELPCCVDASGFGRSTILPSELGCLHQDREKFQRSSSSCLNLLSCAIVASPILCRAQRHKHRGFYRQRDRARKIDLRAVLEDDVHARTVRKWVTDVVIGKDLCPWARTADDQMGIRVVSSTGSTPRAVLQDLLAEARALPAHYKKRLLGEPITTLLACPHVAEWSDVSQFRLFWMRVLESGNVLADDYGMRIVAFHPDFILSDTQLAKGDSINMPMPDGSVERGFVINTSAYVDDDGEDYFAVRFDNGDEQLVSYGRVYGYEGPDEEVGSSGETGVDEDTYDLSSLASRAPRPVLHLLHMDDLDRVNADSREPVLQRNACMMKELGVAGMDALVRACES